MGETFVLSVPISGLAADYIGGGGDGDGGGDGNKGGSVCVRECIGHKRKCK